MQATFAEITERIVKMSLLCLYGVNLSVFVHKFPEALNVLYTTTNNKIFLK